MKFVVTTPKGRETRAYDPNGERVPGQILTDRKRAAIKSLETGGNHKVTGRSLRFDLQK